MARQPLLRIITTSDFLNFIFPHYSSYYEHTYIRAQPDDAMCMMLNVRVMTCQPVLSTSVT